MSGGAADSLPAQLDDCGIHWPTPGSELIIAEGPSAARAIAAVRDPEWQAVLPLQGKPLNVTVASQTRVEASAPLMAVRDALGAGFGDGLRVNRRRYERLILAFDPDADGVHSRSLFLLFLHRYMPRLLAIGAVFAARPPLWQVVSPRLSGPAYAWTDGQFDDLCATLDQRGIHSRETRRFRGVASMPPETIRSMCLDRKTRVLAQLTSAHADAIEAALRRSAAAPR